MSSAGSSSATVSGSVSSMSLRAKSADVGWEYAVKYDPKNSDKLRCLLCDKEVCGGIYRIKQHIAHVRGNVSACPKAKLEDKAKCMKALEEAQRKKRQKVDSFNDVRQEVNIENVENIIEMENEESEARSKTSRFLGPIDRYATRIDPNKNPETQATNLAIWKEKNLQGGQLMARWMYEAGIAFNAIEHDSFTHFTEFIGQLGPGFRKPSRYQLSEPFLKNEVQRTKSLLSKQEEEWKKNGCSIMTDAWSDRRRRSIMNICVNCSEGTAFLSSMEASNDSHTGQFIFDYVDKWIEEIGPKNVVQVVTDNASNNMAAKDLLKEKRPSIFWTSCAAHTINLMLQEIGATTTFKTVIEKARSFTIYIYAHHKTLFLMRKFTNKKDIVRPGVTRFATAFLTLKSLRDKKDALRTMVTSPEWNDTKHAKSSKGIAAANIVLNLTFWSALDICLKVFEPLFKVLRLVDGDQKPSMGFVYGEMLRAKEEIKSVFTQEIHYRQYCEIIDRKSLGRLDSPLHMAAYLLNPCYAYHIEQPNDLMMMNGLIECLERMYPNDFEIVDTVLHKEFIIYMNKDGLFSKPSALRSCSQQDIANYNPVFWWAVYGPQVPNLQRFAIRILGLTTSSSGCERAWSTFEGIHTKKRNRLDATRVNNLAFVQFNCKMANKKKKQLGNNMDVLICNDASNAQEWFVHGGGGDENTYVDSEDLTNEEIRELEEDFVSDEEDEDVTFDFDFEEENDEVLAAFGLEGVLEK